MALGVLPKTSMRKQRFFVAVMALCIATQAKTEKILVPVHLWPANPFQNRWSTFTFVGNRSDEPVTAPGVTFIVWCGIPEGCPRIDVPAKSLAQVTTPASDAGLILEVPKVSDVSISARIAWTPHGFSAAGAEIPIARESSFADRPLHFLNVPIGPGVLNPDVRTHLRIYSLDTGPVRVRVEMQRYRTVDGPVDETHEFELSQRAPPAPPNFLLVDLAVYFPWVVNHTSSENVAVIPIPSHEGRVPRIWALISVTSRTSQVSVLQPH
jgi:hypothetical protein